VQRRVRIDVGFALRILPSGLQAMPRARDLLRGRLQGVLRKRQGWHVPAVQRSALPELRWRVKVLVRFGVRPRLRTYQWNVCEVRDP
jgi:hypothetical protein